MLYCSIEYHVLGGFTSSGVSVILEDVLRVALEAGSLVFLAFILLLGVVELWEMLALIWNLQRLT